MTPQTGEIAGWSHQSFWFYPGHGAYGYRCDVRVWNPERRDWLRCGAVGWHDNRGTRDADAHVHLMERHKNS